MKVDYQYGQSWTEHLGNPPIPEGYVMPVLKNLQGHPEGPRLWDKHISKLVKEELGFNATTHEPCLYYKHDRNKGLILILRQVDGLLLAAHDLSTCEALRATIQNHMANPLNDLGIIKRFNGIDV